VVGLTYFGGENVLYQFIALYDIYDYSIIRRLELTRENTVSSFIDVVDNMFANGEYSGGRIVIVYAFVGWMLL